MRETCFPTAIILFSTATSHRHPPSIQSVRLRRASTRKWVRLGNTPSLNKLTRNWKNLESNSTPSVLIRWFSSLLTISSKINPWSTCRLWSRQQPCLAGQTRIAFPLRLHPKSISRLEDSVEAAKRSQVLAPVWLANGVQQSTLGKSIQLKLRSLASRKVRS